MKNLFNKTIFVLILTGSWGLFACTNNSIENYDAIPIVEKVLKDSTSVYYLRNLSFAHNDDTLPIGILDYPFIENEEEYLPLLQTFINIDNFDNITGKEVPDGIPDFTGENFQCLIDKENLPYESYIENGKQEYLKELMVKNAIFLLGNKYYLASADKVAKGTKPNCKIIILNSELAYRYGVRDIRQILKELAPEIRVIDVVTSTVKEVYEDLKKSDSYDSITVGLFDNNYWEDLLQKPLVDYAKKYENKNYVTLLSQSCGDFKLSPKYNVEGGILPELLPLYSFDIDQESAIITQNESEEITDIKLLSKKNIIKFHVVTFLEKLRNSPEQIALNSIILPSMEQYLYKDVILSEIERLRKYTVNGREIYSHLLAPKLNIIFPYESAAKESYRALRKSNMLALNLDDINSEIFISVPNYTVNTNNLDSAGRLSNEFKLSRQIGKDEETTVIIPYKR